jgi:hypothetical protein
MTRRHVVIEMTKGPRGIDLMTGFRVDRVAPGASLEQAVEPEPRDSRADRILPFPLSL